MIADTGIGISADKLPALFQPFMQADGSATRRYGGTGLGLAISRRLAEALDGHIDVVSELGKGSTFTLSFDIGPTANAGMRAAAPPAIVAAEATSPRGDGITWRGRVLVADDTPDFQRLIRRVLSDMDWQVDVAENGRVACCLAEKSQAERKPYDVILMDMQMPEMDGYQATRWLRDRGWRCPIIALTAHVMAGDREKCLEAGCDDYLSKPIDRHRLAELLERYIVRTTAAQAPAAVPQETSSG